MHKLAAVIQPMKSSFIVAHLRPREFVVEMQVCWGFKSRAFFTIFRLLWNARLPSRGRLLEVLSLPALTWLPLLSVCLSVYSFIYLIISLFFICFLFAELLMSFPVWIEARVRVSISVAYELKILSHTRFQ